MESLTSWKNYIVESYRNVVSEAWQIGSDARSEGYNIYKDLITTTTEIVTDINNSEKWHTTEAPVKKKNKENETANGAETENAEGNKVKLDIFSVETYNKNSTPAIIVAEDDKKSMTSLAISESSI